MAPETILPSHDNTAVRPPPTRPRRGKSLLRVPFTISEAPGRRAAQSRDALYRRSLAGADLLSAALAALIAIPILGKDTLSPASALALPLVVVFSKLIGLYDRDELVLRKTTLDEAPRLFHMATLFSLALWLLEDVLVKGQLGHAQVLGLWGTLFVFALAARTATRRVVGLIAPPERCLLVGDITSERQIARSFADDVRVHAELVGRVPLNDQSNAAPTTGSWDVEDLPAIVAAEDVHRVILAPQAADTEPMVEVIRRVKALGVKVTLLPRMFEVVGSSVVFDDLGGLTVLGLRRAGLPRSSWRIKRAMDLVGSSVGLVAAGPLLALIGLVIKLDSPGPVFFRQTRVGRNGKTFEMLKLRTMSREADALKDRLLDRNESEGLFKIADDPRITRVGRLLRRASLDELPQLINVLRGEMSLVGPRPLVVDEDVRVEGWHRRRLQLVPGMTGHWQILGSSRVPLHEMVKIDYLYITNWSLWSDVKIMLRTIPYVLARRGL